MRMILNKESSISAKNQPEFLGQLEPGDFAEIIGVNWAEAEPSYLQRLIEVGFVEGERLEVLNVAPWSRDPMSVRIKEATYGLRRAEANWIQIRKIAHQDTP
jgi:ferrous iron transport protein A